MAKIGLLFPGQGAQVVGMGRDLIETLPSAQAVYALADKTLGFNLSQVMLEGPEEKLKDTAIAQPALLTASVAAWQVLQTKWTPKPEQVICAGHSLGEYSALVAAGAIDFESALRLVRQRGQAMQAAAAQAQGGMAAVIGPEEQEVAELCREADQDGQVQIANLNCPGQTVISGSLQALERFTTLAQAKSIRVMPLAVSGPFHSSFMKSAAEVLTPALQTAPFTQPRYTVVANVTASPVSDADEIKQRLVEQVCGTVRWTDSIRYMLAQGVDTMVEIGPGKVLRGLMKKIDKTIPVYSAFNPEEIKKVWEQAAVLA